MAFSHGTVATFAVDPAGGSSYTDLSVYLNEITQETETDGAETTTLGNTAKTYIPGLEDGTFEMSGLYDPTADALFNTLRRVIATFRYRPAGAGSGLPQYTGSLILTTYSVETTVEDAAMFEAEFQITGTIVRATQ